MTFAMTSRDFVAYLGAAYAKLEANADYITALDAKNGDGDHWVNLKLGFQKILAISTELESLSLAEALKKIGMTMMSAVGGSSGVLYGSAYLAAAKVAANIDTIDPQTLLSILEAQAQAISQRGQAEPGFKTMLDSLHSANLAYKAALERHEDDQRALEALKTGAENGAEATRNMEAVKGRASYQTHKGVGDLDPGAVTMSYQLGTLADYLIANCLR